MSKTDAVVRLAKAKHEDARQRVAEALRQWPEGLVLTFAAVSKQAKVSKTFLYDPPQADLAEQIRQRRMHTVPMTLSPALSLGGKSDTAKDAQIARLQERVRQHVQEIERLRVENALLYGRLAECAR